MARIFYSLAGEGRGHATRVRAIVEELRNFHEFTIFAPAAAYELLAAAFADSTIQVIKIPGLMFHYSQQRMDYLRTVRDAAGYLFRLNPLINWMEAKIRDGQPDLVITDFDPALPRAAERCGIPYLSIDHQHLLTECDLSQLPLSLRVSASLMAQVVKMYYRHQRETVISSFYFPSVLPLDHNVQQSGVLLRPEVLQASSEFAGHVLVYLRRFASPAILQALKQCRRKVLIYGLGELPSDGNLRFCPVDERYFLEDLSACDALISNAGNQLIGEAIFLGKPVLAIPEVGNFEQFINAHFLRAEGGGDWVTSDRFDLTELMEFLEPTCERPVAVNRHRMNGMPTVIAAIERHLPRVTTPVFINSPFQKVA